jgi:poly(A) polymerase
MMARVAMDNPQAEPPQMLLIFFQTYSQWKWPEPVMLGPICTEPPPGVMPMLAWNPQVNPRDGLHLMPIITPVFPSMNSSYNIGIPQLRRIQDEMCRAAYLLEQSQSNNHPGDCNAIFRDSGFFRRHSNYLQINIRARNAEDFLHWFRLVEARMRLLITSIETPEVQAWPFAKFFDKQYGCTHESYFFIALRFAPGVETVDLRYSTSEFLHKINSWEGRKEGMDLSIARVSADDLPPFVFGEGKANFKKNPTFDISLCPQMVPEGGAMGSPPKRAKLN